MLRTFSIFTMLACFLLCSFVRAEEAPIPPTPSRWVTDTAGFLSVDTQQTLDKRLEQYEKKSGMKVALWIGTTAGDAALEVWAQSAINAWKIREKGFGEGVVMFLLTQDRAIDVEVAPGLAQKLPDEFVGQMIFEQMAPRLDKGDNNGAMTAGMEALLVQLDKPLLATAPSATPNAAPSPSTSPIPRAPAAPDVTDEEERPMFRTPSIPLLVTLGALIVITLVLIATIGRPRNNKKPS